MLWPLVKDAGKTALTCVMIALAIAGSLFLLVKSAQTSWKVTRNNVNKPAYAAMGEFVKKNLPENAVLLVDEQIKLEANTAMFRTDRTCYALHGRPWQSMGKSVIEFGGKPYVISARQLPLKPVLSDGSDGRTLYEWSDSPAAGPTLP